MLLNAFRRLFNNFQNRKARRASGSPRLELLRFEDRINPATITVDTTLDIVNSGDTFISLREAINLANATAGDDIINFSVTGTITLDSLSNTVNASLPTILDATALINGAPRGTLAITGPGSSSLTISGLDDSSGTINSTRNFNIFNIALGGNLSISGVTVSGAKFNSNGGAFNNAGVLTVSNSTLSGNSAPTGVGGGIYNRNTLTLTNSTLSSNTAQTGGGIVNFSGIATVSNSTLSGNSAPTGGGGGIFNSSAGTVNISNSTFSANSANNGGGIYNRNTLTLTNSTISGNSAGSGGGIYNNGGNFALTNSTLSGNTAQRGGGIYNNDSGNLNIANTIIANSTGGDYVGDGTVTVALISPATASSNLVTQAGLAWATTKTSAEINLGTLANNGGPTFTMALLAGSAAIGAGNVSISSASPILGKDQRGINRTTSDIGAYSFGIQVTNTTDSNTVGSGSLRAAITLANTTPGNDQISFSLTGSSPYTITLNGTLGALPTILDATALINGAPRGTVTITGLGASSLTISGLDGGNNARNFRIFNIASGGNLFISGVTVSGANTSGVGGPSNTGTAYGGGFFNSGILTVNNSTISGNTANNGIGGSGSGSGGGIFNYNGTLSVSNSTISGNTAGMLGGGIENRGGTLTVNNSTLFGNTAGGGGGIHNGGTLTVNNSTLSGNTAGGGGGISNVATLNISNSTISGNTASSGGGIYNYGPQYPMGSFGTLNIANTIIANSTNGGDYAGGGTVVLIGSATAANNLITQLAPIPGIGDWATTVTSVQLNLGPLQNNGGPTFTMALLTGSSAIGAGNATISNATPINGKDQRGINRTTSDIGAYSFGIQVTTTADTVNSTDNVTSLREAITLANTTPGNDQISFNLTGANTYTITLAAALPTIVSANTLVSGGTAGTVTITGLGASLLSIDGSLGGFSIFSIDTGGDLSISGVTVSGANNTSGNGGGFKNSGILNISNSIISGNTSTSDGGAVGNYNGGTLNIANSTLSDNSASQGGAVANGGTTTISNSTLSSNRSAARGGAIVNNGNLTVTNSTISGNSSLFSGGGIENNSGTLSLSNSTIYTNSAVTYGGGIFNGATLTITNSTLSNNSAAALINSVSGGGGIFNRAGSTLNIANTIIASSTSGGDYAGGGNVIRISPSTATNNIVTQATSSATNLWAQSVTTALLNLGPLQNNGGPTLTMALLTGSAAIGAGNATISNATPINGKDQRGINRTTSDIGAYSFGIQVTTTADTVNSTDNVTSLREAITLANTTPGNDQISFNLPGSSPYTITLNGTLGALPTIIDATTAIPGGTAGTVTITGLGASSLTISGSDITNVNNATRDFNIFNIAAGGNLLISGVTVSGGQQINNGGGFFNSGILTVNNSTISGNTVNFQTGSSTGSGGGIFNFNGILTVNNSTISGNTAGNNGGGIYSSGTLAVTNSTISGNSANNGGGILNYGALTVTNSTISGNSASGNGVGINNGIGGAICSYFGRTLTITNSTISGNSATYGGGIFADGNLTITDSIISGNIVSQTNSGTINTYNSKQTSYGDFYGGVGGGLYLSSGTAIISNSTISGNTASFTNTGSLTVGNIYAGNGGGISIYNAMLTISNSTISGNSASFTNTGILDTKSNVYIGEGGGIFNNHGILNITNVTISGNSATTSLGNSLPPTFVGGGIFNNSMLNIANTIMANSTSGGDYAGGGKIGTNLNNLVEDGTLPGSSEITGDPLLGPLQNNGGPTFTMALLTGSAAIGAGNATISNATPINGKDQRGINRTTSDIGAYSFGIQVTTTADTVNSTDNVTSLREAITLANTTPGNDQISFNLTGSSTYTITLNGTLGALPTIIDASTAITGGTAGTLTIIGLGASSLTISGSDPTNVNNATRNFNIFNIAAGGNLLISGVTVSGGQQNNNGGGFFNSGILTVNNSTISGNTVNFSSGTGTGSGGGIFNFNGILTVNNSTISGNTAGFFGGGIGNFSGGTVTVSNSTISGNTGDIGGGIANRGTLSVSNSTISGNSANFGGGIGNAFGGTLTITNSTLSGNSATSGGGIHNSNSTLNIANTIIANSTNGGDYAGSGTIGTNTNNLVEDGTLPAGTNNKTGDPNLGPLQNNGGPTATMALLTPSPAISTTLLVTPNLDQRSFTRINNDIGAYAYYAAPTVVSISPTSGSTAGGTVITITGTNFVAGPNVVSINGVAATNVNFVSATSITATSPAGTAGANKSVLVTSAGGTNAANTLFTYAAAPIPTPTPTPPTPTPTPIPTYRAPLVVGTPSPSSGGSSTVTLYDPATGQPTGTAVPFPGFTGPIHVASGDFNNDGVADIFAAAGFGGGPAIAILNSQTGEVIEAFFAFDPSFTGGVFIAVRDFNGDGILDIIAGAGAGGGPEVRLFDGASLNVLGAFYAYDQSFTGGVSVASIDFNNDGILDLVTGAGPGGAPHVKVFDGATSSILSQWYAYPASFTGGVFVALGDIGNDGTFEVVTGAGLGGAPVVAVWDPYTGALLAQFMAYAEDFTGGVRVAVNDGNSDGIADIVTGAGAGGGPQVNVFNFPELDLLFSFYSGEQSNTGGVFVS